eukprot:7001172-Pyramimonas_sp.AAC.1
MCATTLTYGEEGRRGLRRTSHSVDRGSEGVEEVDDWEDAWREARDAATVQDRAQRQLIVARADARAARIAASAERRIVPARGVDGAVANEEDGRTTSGRVFRRPARLDL